MVGERGPVTVAVTGPFASGKSTFVGMLAELGAETVSADEVVHRLLSSDDETISRVLARFGDEIMGEEGRIDRRRLGAMVFADPAALAELEGMLHPAVRREIRRRMESSWARWFVAEVPLLFEASFEEDFDLTVAVTAPEERRREWAAQRSLDEDVFAAVESRQLSGREKAARADLVVENDGTKARLREYAKELEERIFGDEGV